MNWLQNNPIGTVLAAASGVLVLLALGMAIVWNMPVSVDTTEAGAVENGAEKVVAANEIGDISQYQIVDQKPVFNESRTPEVAGVDDDEMLADSEVEIKGAPDVRLTGVIITPSTRIASLMPADQKLENIMAREGESLTGDYVGWQVSAVHPRAVVLESRDGQSLELELKVHDEIIKEPPKPVPPAKTAQADNSGDELETGEDGEPLSRAEQIRQRIAERREELRREQEEQNSQTERRPILDSTPGQGTQASKPSAYQQAIRNMMKNNTRGKDSNGKEDS